MKYLQLVKAIDWICPPSKIDGLANRWLANFRTSGEEIFVRSPEDNSVDTAYGISPRFKFPS